MLTDLRLAREQSNPPRVEELTTIRAERFHLMDELAKLPKDMVFFIQITMEAGEDAEYLAPCGRRTLRALWWEWKGNGGGSESDVQRLELLRRRAD